MLASLKPSLCIIPFFHSCGTPDLAQRNPVWKVQRLTPVYAGLSCIPLATHILPKEPVQFLTNEYREQ
jgi:hypothetical protein